MTMLWADGFETFDPSGNRTNLDNSYDFTALTASGDAGIVEGRENGLPDPQAMAIGSLVADHTFAVKALLPLGSLSTGSTWIIGIAFKANSGLPGTIWPLMGFKDSEDAEMLTLCVTSSGGLSLRRGGSSGTQIEATTSVNLGTDWRYIEFSATLHGSTGAYEVKVDETSVMSDTNVNTTATGGTQPYQFFLAGGPDVAKAWYWDDFVLMDDQGSVNNAFLGDMNIIKIRPNAVGDSSDFTPTSGDNYDNVNEDTVDGDTTTVTSPTPGHIDLYHYEDIVDFGDIAACIPKPVIQKDPGGTRSFRTLCKSGSTTENGDTQWPSAGTYRRMQDLYELNPDGDVAWDATTVSAAQFGLEIVS